MERVENILLPTVAAFMNRQWGRLLCAIDFHLKGIELDDEFGRYFNHQNLPDLDPSIEQLTFEIVNLGPHELAQVMALAGVKYLPSVLYKVRMIPFASDAMKAEVPAVTSTKAPGDVDDPVAPEE